MNSHVSPPNLAITALMAALMAPLAAPGQVIITEVLPAVSTNEAAGDTVELYNNGVSAVNLTDWILSDLDPATAETSLLNEPTFAPVSLSLPDLEPGEFAVIVFTDTNGAASFANANYGLYIEAPLSGVGSSYLGSETDQLVLTDDTGAPQDFVAWWSSADPMATDDLEDINSFTAPTSDYGLAIGNAGWNGADNMDQTAAEAAVPEFTAYDGVSTYGQGGLRRRSTAGVFQVGSPDGLADWEAVARDDIYLGDFSEVLATANGRRPRLATADITDWLIQADRTFSPEYRVAVDTDNNDFVAPLAQDLTDWEAVLAHALAGEWEEAFDDAHALGYEVVEVLDTGSGETFHVLREQDRPGEASFTGMGIYVFYNGVNVRDYLMLQAPHPRWDTNTLDQAALALPQVWPRVTMIAGTHRNNSTTNSLCDGEFSAGVPYRISDVAHHEDNFFHRTSVYLGTQLTDAMAIQLHGFCCPGSGSYTGVTHDVIVSNGTTTAPAWNELTKVWAEEIDNEAFIADNGSGGDLTEAAIYPADENVLGGTTNVQGRVINGVAPGDACDDPALAPSGRFVHIEQDPDVREEPQHIITALITALDLVETGVPVELDHFGVE